MASIKLDYFEGLVKNVNKKLGFDFTVKSENGEIALFSKKGRVFGTQSPQVFESAIKSLKKDGTISHYLFEERKDYRDFIAKEKQAGVSPKEAHKKYFENLL